ncbi:hypothetical protein PR048_004515 [Dryococelus australis]|uniref:Uncharacterized protein n=1 Tax=Dryococelus australis TaxID=614101 RepID=A0ABQ9I5P1_9NEOP|nr:hypothetical protein PR048_004515 [Dryococelus australis]
MEPIAQATEELSSERYPTLGLVIPLLQGIQYVLDRLYLMATAVDTRFKMEALPDDSKVLAKQYCKKNEEF